MGLRLQLTDKFRLGFRPRLGNQCLLANRDLFSNTSAVTFTSSSMAGFYDDCDVLYVTLATEILMQLNEKSLAY